jgi:integrase
VGDRHLKFHELRDNLLRRPHRPGGAPVEVDDALAQAEAVLTAAASAPLHAYIVLSLLIGARTEDLRALTWDDVDTEGRPDVAPPVPPSISVVRSVRVGGDTKTRRSRRRTWMPLRCVEALRRHRARHAADRLKAGARWTASGLVFTSSVGTALDARNVRRAFRCRRGCRRYRGHRDRLPAAAQAGDGGGRDGDGPHLPEQRRRVVVTQIVTRCAVSTRRDHQN